MAQIHKLQLAGELKHVRAACDFAVAAAQAAGLNQQSIFYIELSVEEIVTNIIEHGYKNTDSDKTIEIITEQRADQLRISIIDQAPPFNPLEAAAPDPKTPLSARGEGGWGIAIVKQTMTQVSYSYENGHNRLTLVKKL